MKTKKRDLTMLGKGDALFIPLRREYFEAFESGEKSEEYIAKGVCSDCGACSLKDAEGKCRPRALGDTGDVTCAGEPLWRDEDE